MSSSRAQQLRHAMQQLFRRFGAMNTDCTPCGKPLSMVHAHALMVLQARGALSQQQLGEELCIDKSNVARLCAKLVEAGHAEQAASQLDARSRVVTLTGQGLRLARDVDKASSARFARLLAALPAGRQPDVIAALEALVAAIDASARNEEQ